MGEGAPQTYNVDTCVTTGFQYSVALVAQKVISSNRLTLCGTRSEPHSCSTLFTEIPFSF